MTWSILQQLPKLQQPFVLITGDSTRSVPSEIFSVGQVLPMRKSFNTKILDNPKVLHWYAVTFDGSFLHPKLSGIPLAELSYNGPHLLNPTPGTFGNAAPSWGGGRVRNQDQELYDLARALPKANQRIPKIYYDAHHINSDERWKNKETVLWQYYDKLDKPVKFLTRAQIKDNFKGSVFLYRRKKIT